MHHCQKLLLLACCSSQNGLCPNSPVPEFGSAKEKQRDLGQDQEQTDDTSRKDICQNPMVCSLPRELRTKLHRMPHRGSRRRLQHPFNADMWQLFKHEELCLCAPVVWLIQQACSPNQRFSAYKNICILRYRHQPWEPAAPAPRKSNGGF